jgi:hypothetical protein
VDSVCRPAAVLGAVVGDHLRRRDHESAAVGAIGADGIEDEFGASLLVLPAEPLLSGGPSSSSHRASAGCAASLVDDGWAGARVCFTSDAWADVLGHQSSPSG